MSAYIIPAFIITIIVYSIVKKKNAYTCFVFGAKTSFDLVLTSFPYIVAIFIAIDVFVASGLSASFANFIAPFLNLFGIPPELGELILIKPFSGCGSLAILQNIYTVHGPDSYLARAASTIAGSSEAIFFVTAVFFSRTKINKFRYGIPVALIANFVGAVVGVWITLWI